MTWTSLWTWFIKYIQNEFNITIHASAVADSSPRLLSLPLLLSSRKDTHRLSSHSKRLLRLILHSSARVDPIHTCCLGQTHLNITISTDISQPVILYLIKVSIVKVSFKYSWIFIVEYALAMKLSVDPWSIISRLIFLIVEGWISALVEIIINYAYKRI